MPATLERSPEASRAQGLLRDDAEAMDVSLQSEDGDVQMLDLALPRCRRARGVGASDELQSDDDEVQMVDLALPRCRHACGVRVSDDLGTEELDEERFMALHMVLSSCKCCS